MPGGSFVPNERQIHETLLPRPRAPGSPSFLFPAQRSSRPLFFARLLSHPLSASSFLSAKVGGKGFLASLTRRWKQKAVRLKFACCIFEAGLSLSLSLSLSAELDIIPPIKTEPLASNSIRDSDVASCPSIFPLRTTTVLVPVLAFQGFDRKCRAWPCGSHREF